MTVGEIDINLVGVLLAGVSSMAIGAIYYSNAVYSKQWKKLAKIDEKRFQKDYGKTLPLIFLSALVTAYVIGFLTCLYQAFYDVPWLTASMVTALLVWLVVSANVYIQNALSQRPGKLTAIFIGNRFLSIMAMGLILGWLHS